MLAPVAMLAPVSRRGGVASPLLSGLISYWKMDEMSGVRMDSVLSSGNNLTDNNTVGSTTGKIGTAGQFIAANTEWLSIPDNPSVSLGADQSFTWSMWAKFDSLTANRGLLRKFSGAGQAEYEIYYDTGLAKIVFALMAIGITDNGIGTIATGTWYLIVVWHDAENNVIGIQTNNVTATIVPWSGGTTDNAADVTIGRRGNNIHDGQIDEVGFWKRALTSTERASLYNGGSGLTYPF